MGAYACLAELGLQRVLDIAWSHFQGRGRGREVGFPNTQESRGHPEPGEWLAQADSLRRGEEAASQARSPWPPVPLPGG